MLASFPPLTPSPSLLCSFTWLLAYRAPATHTRIRNASFSESLCLLIPLPETPFPHMFTDSLPPFTLASAQIPPPGEVFPDKTTSPLTPSPFPDGLLSIPLGTTCHVCLLILCPLPLDLSLPWNYGLCFWLISESLPPRLLENLAHAW